MPAAYYDGFVVMVFAPALLILLVLVIYAALRSCRRGLLLRRHAVSGVKCTVGAPTRLHRTPLVLTRGGRVTLGLWDKLDTHLDSLEASMCACFGCCQRWRASRGAAYSTARAVEASIASEVTRLELGTDAHPRLRTLRILASLAGGARGARLWKGLSMLRDDHNMLGGCELCACVPRDPAAEQPARFALCERGREQYFLLGLRMRVCVRARGAARRRFAGGEEDASFGVNHRCVRAQAIRGILSVLVFSYAPLVSTILGMWNCVEVRAVGLSRLCVSVSSELCVRFAAHNPVVGIVCRLPFS